MITRHLNEKGKNEFFKSIEDYLSWMITYKTGIATSEEDNINSKEKFEEVRKNFKEKLLALLITLDEDLGMSNGQEKKD